MVKQDYSFCISAVTEFEIYTGATDSQLEYWKDFLKKIQVLSFNKDVVKVAVELNRLLKKKRKQIDMADLFIAATAIDNKLPLATLNRKHFEIIDRLELV